MRSRSIYGREYSMKGFRMGENKCLSKSNFCMKRITLDLRDDFADRSSNYYYYFLVIRSKSKPNRSNDLFIRSNGLVNRSNGFIKPFERFTNPFDNPFEWPTKPFKELFMAFERSTKPFERFMNCSITVHHPCVFAVRTVFR